MAATACAPPLGGSQHFVRDAAVLAGRRAHDNVLAACQHRRYGQHQHRGNQRRAATRDVQADRVQGLVADFAFEARGRLQAAVAGHVGAVKGLDAFTGVADGLDQGGVHAFQRRAPFAGFDFQLCRCDPVELQRHGLQLLVAPGPDPGDDRPHRIGQPGL
jgi:hypothetical protein